MAYVSKEMKAEKAPRLRALAKQYGLTATVAVRHSSTLILNVSKGPIDFIKNQADTVYENNHWAADKDADYAHNCARKYLNVSHFHTESFSGNAKEFLDKAFSIMYEGHYDRSDIMTDYFDVSFYVDINIGRWDKPYILTA